MSVEPFDPGALPLKLDSTVIGELLVAAQCLEDAEFGLTRERISALAVAARHGGDIDWQIAAADLSAAEMLALIRLFTLAERLPGWEAGAKSPVIVLAAALKARGDYPADLTAWIKANTDNRFLPYGSLMDRL